MFEEPLPKTTRTVLKALGQLPLVRKFYLTGGTALALSYAHRKSDDLDFFSRNRFNPSEVGKLNLNRL